MTKLMEFRQSSYRVQVKLCKDLLHITTLMKSCNIWSFLSYFSGRVVGNNMILSPAFIDQSFIFLKQDKGYSVYDEPVHNENQVNFLKSYNISWNHLTLYYDWTCSTNVVLHF